MKDGRQMGVATPDKNEFPVHVSSPVISIGYQLAADKFTVRPAKVGILLRKASGPAYRTGRQAGVTNEADTHGPRSSDITHYYPK
jgi:hypothetical protein